MAYIKFDHRLKLIKPMILEDMAFQDPYLAISFQLTSLDKVVSCFRFVHRINYSDCLRNFSGLPT